MTPLASVTATETKSAHLFKHPCRHRSPLRHPYWGQGTNLRPSLPEASPAEFPPRALKRKKRFHLAAISPDRHGFDAWLLMLGAYGSAAIRRAGETIGAWGSSHITRRSGPECRGWKQTGDRLVCARVSCTGLFKSAGSSARIFVETCRLCSRFARHCLLSWWVRSTQKKGGEVASRHQPSSRTNPPYSRNRHSSSRTNLLL